MWVTKFFSWFPYGAKLENTWSSACHRDWKEETRQMSLLSSGSVFLARKKKKFQSWPSPLIPLLRNTGEGPKFSEIRELWTPNYSAHPLKVSSRSPFHTDSFADLIFTPCINFFLECQTFFLINTFHVLSLPTIPCIKLPENTKYAPNIENKMWLNTQVWSWAVHVKILNLYLWCLFLLLQNGVIIIPNL